MKETFMFAIFIFNSAINILNVRNILIVYYKL